MIHTRSVCSAVERQKILGLVVIISVCFVLGDRACESSGTMAVNVDIITSAAVFPPFPDTHSVDVKIKMLIVFISIEPPTSR